MLQKSGRLVLWEAMFILELHSAETQEICIEFSVGIPYSITKIQILYIAYFPKFCIFTLSISFSSVNATGGGHLA